MADVVEDPRLLQRVGRGGMGVVYRARDPRVRQDVAIKLLAEDGGADATAFLEEGMAMARLRHPGIVDILDFGYWAGPVPPGVRPGSPFLMMELLPGGTLTSCAGALAWPEVRGLLLALLDALAHSHARDLIHRDVKPDNVLRAGSGEWCLVDFGLARAGGRQGPRAGTPQYMAPEQLRGGEVGPWSDLFAVGTLAWMLVTGALPRSGGVRDLLQAAETGSRPPFEPRVEVPTGLSRWLAAMMDPSPSGRFDRAAAAASALAMLPEAETTGVSAGSVPLASDTLYTLANLMGPEAAPPVGPSLPGPVWTPTELPTPAVVVPLAAAEPNVGLGLVGWAEPPLVGRHAEQQVLWEALRRARQGGLERCWVHGPPGCGKSRLAQWLARRSHELSAATVVDVSRAVGASELAQVVSRTLRRTVEPTISGVASALAAAAVLRPVVLVWDGQPESTSPDPELDEALAWSFADAPILQVVVSRDGPPAADPALALPVPWLSGRDVVRMLVSWLGLDPALAQRTASAVAGSPRDALDLVARWAGAGRLVSGGDGLTMGQTPADAAPLDGVPAAHGLHLELLAVLGVQVERGVVDRAAESDGLGEPSRALLWAQRAGWVVGVEGGVRFRDPERRAALLSAASTAGRAPRWNRAAALALADRAPPEVLGRHLWAAGDLAEADRLLAAGADARWCARDYHGALLAFEDLERLRHERADRRGAAHAAGWRGFLLLNLGQLDGARREAERVFAEGEALDDDGLRASGMHTAAVVDQVAMAPGTRARLLRAAALYRSGGSEENARIMELGAMRDDPVASRLLALEAVQQGDLIWSLAHRELGRTLVRCGEGGRAIEVLEELVAVRHARGETVASDVLALGDALRVVGRLDEAHALYTGLLTDHSVAVGRILRRDVALALALVDLARGEVETARRVCRRIELRVTASGDELNGRVLRAVLVAIAATLDDQPAFDRWARRLLAGPPVPAMVDPFVERLLASGGARWRAGGDVARADVVDALLGTWAVR